MVCTSPGVASSSRVLQGFFCFKYSCKIGSGGNSGRRNRVAISPPRAFSDLKLNSQRSSPDQVKKEIQSCYGLIQKLGRGAIYLGSSRVKDDHPHYLQAIELARDDHQ